MNASFYDNVKAICKCKSRYNSKHYDCIKKLISSHFEIIGIFKKLEKIERYTKYVINDEDRKKLGEKSVLYIDNNKISTDDENTSFPLQQSKTNLDMKKNNFMLE